MATLELVRAGLVARAPEVAIALVGEPNRGLSSKRELRFGRHGSMAVVITGPKAGLWCDYETGDGGDMLALVMRERRAGFTDALDFAADLLALPPRECQRPMRQARQDEPAAAEVVNHAGICSAYLAGFPGDRGHPRRSVFAEPRARRGGRNVRPCASLPRRLPVSPH
jgi:hypothetical protein